jgi:hypothetical protein
MLSVAVEAFDPTDDVVVRDAQSPTRYEQVKERAPRGGNWTAANLVDEGITDQFIRQHAADATGIIGLFTASNASEFRQVSERARNARSNHSSDGSGVVASEAEWWRKLPCPVHSS